LLLYLQTLNKRMSEKFAFRPISRYILETILDRSVVVLER